MVNYEFRYVVKMTNGKEYEIITNFHGEKDVLKYIDTHDYIDLFDRKIEEMVAVKSEYVMSVLYKDSQKTDSEGNVNWANREDYLKEENERLQQENEQLKQRLDENYYNEWQDTLEDARHFAIKCLDLEKENKKLKEENNKLEQIREIKDNALKGADIKIKTLERENHDFKKRNALLMNTVDDLDKENKALRLQSDTYFEEWQNEKLRCESKELK